MKLKKLGVMLSVLIISGLVIVPSGIGSKIYADIKSLILVKDEAVNEFAAGVKIDVDEGDFTDKDNWEGKETDKVVKIPNKGETPVFVRVAIVPRWVDENGNPWPGDVSRDVVNIEYVNSSSWLKDNDGYYYYKSIVGAGESTNEIIKSVELKTEKITDQYEQYKGKALIVDVKSEAVEASSEAYKAVWPILSQGVKDMLNDLLK